MRSNGSVGAERGQLCSSNQKIHSFYCSPAMRKQAKEDLGWGALGGPGSHIKNVDEKEGGVGVSRLERIKMEAGQRMEKGPLGP